MSCFKFFLSSLLAIASLSLSTYSMDWASEDSSESEEFRSEITYGSVSFCRSAPIEMVSRDWDRDFCVMSSGCGGSGSSPDSPLYRRFKSLGRYLKNSPLDEYLTNSKPLYNIKNITSLPNSPIHAIHFAGLGPSVDYAKLFLDNEYPSDSEEEENDSLDF